LQQDQRSGIGWDAITYPDVLATAASRTSPAHRGEKRYSAMALAQRTSSRLMWTWFLAAPAAEKARWLGRVFFQPRRAAQWLSWQLRTGATRTR
jgi:hypothetical protein